MKILVAYDGTIHAKTALRYGLQKAGRTQGELILLQVFDRSAFIDYEGGPQAETLARAEASEQLREAERIITAGAGSVASRVVSEEGDPEAGIRRHAEAGQVDLVLVPPRYKAARGRLACPVYIIPGTILVPVDHTEGALDNLGLITEEAQATRSRIVLMGIVPVHLYSREEKAELETVKQGTLARVSALASALSGNGIESRQVMRSGYPDEEILKAAEEFSATVILIPSGGDVPSELTKAAGVILGEPERPPLPIQFLSAEPAR